MEENIIGGGCMKWSRHAWMLAGEVYDEILRHPFIQELASGTLLEEKFLFYLAQDSYYLDSYCRVLCHIASRLPEQSQTEAFIRFASDGVAVEKALHGSFLAGHSMPDMSPTCLAYTSFEKSMAYEPVEVEAASILPCFWVYQKVGEHILRLGGDLNGNPYARWIETYGDEYFAEATTEAIAICDRLADDSTDGVRARMAQVFIDATRLELAFWDSAYRLEKWKV